MSYVIAGYGVTAAVLGLYALRVVRRGRVLARSLPPADATSEGGRWR